MLRIVTARLELVASTPEIARDEANGRAGWHVALDVDPPSSWPPPLNEAATLRWFADAVARDPAAEGWYAWYVVLRRPRALVGQAGFKGRPDRHGSVEIGYSVLPAHECLGYGTELVEGLATWAFADASVARVLADTYPEFAASVRVLEKNGFSLLGRADPPGAVRYELRREVHELRRRRAPYAVRRAP